MSFECDGPAVQVLLNVAFGTDAKATAIFDELRELGNRRSRSIEKRESPSHRT